MERMSGVGLMVRRRAGVVAIGHLRMGRKLIFMFFLSFLLLLTLPFGTHSFAAGTRIYILGVVPQLTPLDTHRRWTPFVQRLQKMTGLPIELKLYQNIPQFEADFLKGIPDFVFLNPYHEVMAKRAQGYIPLVRDGSKPLVGILVVRKDSPIHSVRELNFKEIAFPAPNSLGASLYMRALLAEREKITIIPRYVQTHSNVFRYVVLGFAAAGGAVNKTLSKEPPGIRSRLRILYRTPGLAPHPLSVHPRVAQKVRQAVRQAVLEMAQTKGGRRILAAVQLRKPIAADYQRDYAPLDKLKLGKYVVAAP